MKNDLSSFVGCIYSCRLLIQSGHFAVSGLKNLGFDQLESEYCQFMQG
jgi:hypothetical protein